jgi:hypothetical protein
MFGRVRRKASQKCGAFFVPIIYGVEFWSGVIPRYYLKYFVS